MLLASFGRVLGTFEIEKTRRSPATMLPQSGPDGDAEGPKVTGAKSWAKNWASWVLKFGTPTPEGRRTRSRAFHQRATTVPSVVSFRCPLVVKMPSRHIPRAIRVRVPTLIGFARSSIEATTTNCRYKIDLGWLTSQKPPKASQRDPNYDHDDGPS